VARPQRETRDESGSSPLPMGLYGLVQTKNALVFFFVARSVRNPSESSREVLLQCDANFSAQYPVQKRKGTLLSKYDTYKEQ
jgi:hypothetical protein